MIEDGAIDAIAKAIHENYLRTQLDRGASTGATAALQPWDAVNDDLKEVNRALARDIAAKLESIGCVVEAGVGEFAFTPAEVESLSVQEHERWCRQRTEAGWTYGEVRDDVAKRHPSLISWDDLVESERDKDRDVVLGIPKVLGATGLYVVRVAART